MKKKGGVLFDYNGVVVDDEKLHETAAIRVLATYGATLTPAMHEEHCLGRTDHVLAENLKKLFPQLQEVPTEELVQAKIAQYVRLVAETNVLYPNIRAIMQSLSEHFALALVTGSLRAELDPVIKGTRIMELFQAVVTAEDITRSKPDPEGYLKAVAALGLPKEKIVVIEDSPSGVQAAKAANLKCIAVLHTVSRDKLQDADLILDSVAQVTPEVIERLLS